MNATPDDSQMRPRLWVPGTLVVSGEGELVVGSHVGFNGYGKEFATSPCGHFGSLDDWRHRAWMLRRADLTDDVIEEYAIVVPETLLDAEQQPYAKRWLAEQPLVCVSGDKVAHLLDGGLRVYTVAYGAEEDEFLEVSARGDGAPTWSLRTHFGELLPKALQTESDASFPLRASERLDARTLMDRVLNEISGGALRDISVVNALAARRLIEPGYGYRGATRGKMAAIEAVTESMESLNGVFANVYRRARAHQHHAETIATRIREASAHATSLGEIPVYSSTRNVTLDQLRIPMLPGAYLRDGDARNTLILAQEARWFVERVALLEE